MIRRYYYFVRFVVTLFYKVFTRWKTEGLDNVPDKGAILLVSNHLSNADPPLISVTLRRDAIFMAKKELFNNPVLGYLLFGLGAFPVNRGQLDRQALRHSEWILSENKALVMFPEAARSKGARLQTAYPGSALIAVRHNIPIIPVAITGTEKMAGWGWLYRRCPVIIRFGKPFNLPDTGKKRTRDKLEEVTKNIMEHIAALLPDEYRGVYDTGKNNNESAD